MNNVNTEMIPVFFHKDIVFLTAKDGEPYTSMRPVIENMGLAWQVQHKKLTDNAKRWGVTIMVTPSNGGEQEALCIPVRKLPGFLATINPKKVNPELRDKIELYQEECDNALWSYWTKGVAIRKPAILKEIRDTHSFVKRFIAIAIQMGCSKETAQTSAIEAARAEGFRLPDIKKEETVDSVRDFIGDWLNGRTRFPVCCARVKDLSLAYSRYCVEKNINREEKRQFCIALHKIKALHVRKAFKSTVVVAVPFGKTLSNPDTKTFEASIFEALESI